MIENNSKSTYYGFITVMYASYALYETYFDPSQDYMEL